MEAENLSWELAPTGTRASLRGLAAVNDRVLWACGSRSTVITSSDGGASWSDASPDFGDLEFRSIHAWDQLRACVASAGTPAIILTTKDAGQTWKEVHREVSEHAFFDGLKFWDDQRGIVFSDPVEGCLLVLETRDTGQTWQPIDGMRLPSIQEGEAGFAASNSSLAVGPGGSAWIGTGGADSTMSRIHFREKWDGKWRIAECPIASGEAQGVFSIAVDANANSSNANSASANSSEVTLVAVGGDYRADKTSNGTAAISTDGGENWTVCTNPPPAFRSCVVALIEGGWLSVGPTGSDFSKNGQVWKTFTSTGFHVIQQGDRNVFAVGSDGRFAVLNKESHPESGSP